MNPPILNREFQHPADGWYQIEPKGEHPNRKASVIQVIDSNATNAIVNRFNLDAAAGKLSHGAEMLIDHEHFRHDADKETRAYGWLQQLQDRADGIYGKIRWTNTGKEAVDGGDYRFFSTEYDPADAKILNRGKVSRVRPLKLDGLTLTNSPNNKGGRPITNRTDKFPPGTHADADKPKENQTMKSVASSLGLSDEASESAILAEVAKLHNRATTAEAKIVELAPFKNRAEAAEQKLKDVESEKEVEATLDKYQNRFAKDKRAGWKKSLLTNRDTTVELLEGLPVLSGPLAQGKRILNRAEAKSPEGTADAQPTGEITVAQLDGEVRKIMNRDGLKDFGTAYTRLQSEQPALFAKAQ